MSGRRHAAISALDQARRRLLRKTRGKYPAMNKALEVIVKSYRANDEKIGLALERDAVLELAASPIAISPGTIASGSLPVGRSTSP